MPGGGIGENTNTKGGTMKKNLYKEEIPIPDWLFPYFGEIQYQAETNLNLTCSRCGAIGHPAKLQLELGLWQVWWLCPDCLFVLRKRTFTTRGQADEC